MASNPFPDSRAPRWIWWLVWFVLGFCAGQFAMGWALKPDSYTFPTYKLAMPQMEPDT